MSPEYNSGYTTYNSGYTTYNSGYTTGCSCTERIEYVNGNLKTISIYDMNHDNDCIIKFKLKLYPLLGNEDIYNKLNTMKVDTDEL